MLSSMVLWQQIVGSRQLWLVVAGPINIWKDGN
jgi:hypothetical protein